MKFTNRQSTLFTLIGLAVAWVCAMFMLSFFQLPALSEKRSLFDSDRIVLLTVQEQQNDLAAVQTQIQNIDNEQATLNDELWLFADEESFFSRWDAFAQSHGVMVDLAQVADVVPSQQPLTRGLELTIQGEPRSLLRAIEDLQKNQPLLAIQQIKLTPGLVTDELTAQLNIETVWQ